MKPERAFWLAIDAMEAGWTVLVKPQVDFGDNPFITVEGVKGDAYFSATWHTRDTGSYRVFGATLGRHKSSASRSTLRAIREQLERSTA